MARYLITGGTGFLGVTLARRLLDAGHEVRVIARGRNAALIQRGAIWTQGSVMDPALLNAASLDVDGIFHLAGRVDHTRRHGFDAFREIHVHGTRAILERASEIGARVVYASTCGTVAVGREPEIFGERATYKDDLTAGWPYYLTKIEAERMALDLAARDGIALVVMRPALLLGPDDWNLSSSRTVLDFLDRKIPFVPPGGVNVVDVRDCAEVFETAMTRGVTLSTYLIGATNLTLAELFARLAELSSVAPPRLKLPTPLALLGASLGARLMDLAGHQDPGLDPVVVELASHFWFVDDAAARADLGWRPRALDDTLRDSIAWVRANREVLRAR